MTAYAMPGDRDRCIEAGCDDYLPKPITIADLLRLISFYSDMVEKRANAEAASTQSVPMPAVTNAAINPVTAPPVPTVTSVPPVMSPVAPGAVPSSDTVTGDPITTAVVPPLPANPATAATSPDSLVTPSHDAPKPPSGLTSPPKPLPVTKPLATSELPGKEAPQDHPAEQQNR